MATIVLVYPRDGGTYGTNADGTLVPFTARGYVDAPGATVTLYEDNTGALLGSTNASTTPDAGGDYSGWYPWTIFVSSWTQAGGVSAPAASVSATAGGVSLTATLTVPAATATSSAGGILASSTTLQLVPAASASAAAGGVSVAGVRSVPAATATGAAGDISIAEQPSGPLSLGLPNPGFESAIGTVEGDNWWPVLVGDGSIERSSVSPIAGSYSGRINGAGAFNGESNDGAWPQLVNRVTKSAVDASTGHLKFKAKRLSADLDFHITADVYDAGGSKISTAAEATGANIALLWGNNYWSSPVLTYKVASPVIGTIYDFDIDVASWLASICTWANASKVIFAFAAGSQNGSETVVIDSFEAR